MAIKTIYTSPDDGFGQTIIYEDTTLYPASVIIVKTKGNGQEQKDMIVSKEAIISAARQLAIF